ncbi:MAG TPA: hypothetical protein VLX58_12450 [Bryobacteraceae bacterium]|nr:hypothetical protein [Bryobacteraceae bacterium]
MRKPFAVLVYERFLNGESIQELSDDLSIPADRIEQRLRAAAVYLKKRRDLNLTALVSGDGRPLAAGAGRQSPVQK